MNLKDIQAEIQRRQGQRDLIRQRIAAHKSDVAELEERRAAEEQAAVIIQEVASLTQQELEYHISELVSVALAAVFPEPYDFLVEFVIRRDQTECDISFKRGDGEAVDPMSASGGGPVEVAAFALRVSLWSLQPERTRPVFILDEPFRCVSTDLQTKAGDMLNDVSERLGLQVIMVSHERELMETADAVFRTRIKEGKTEVV